MALLQIVCVINKDFERDKLNGYKTVPKEINEEIFLIMLMLVTKAKRFHHQIDYPKKQ